MKHLHIVLFVLAVCLILSGCSDGDTQDTDDPFNTSDTVDTTAEIPSDSKTEETEDATDTDEADDTTDSVALKEPDLLATLPEIDGVIYIDRGTLMIDSLEWTKEKVPFSDGTGYYYESTESPASVSMHDALLAAYDKELHSHMGYAEEDFSDVLTTILIGDAKLNVKMASYDFYTNGEKRITYTIESVEVYGMTIIPAYEEEWSLFNTEIYCAGDLFVMTAVNNMRTYIIHSDGYIVTDGDTAVPGDWFGGFQYYFYSRKEGLMYDRIAIKFHKNLTQWVDEQGIFEACVARDELYSESGWVTVEDGNLKLVAEKRLTAEEVYDLDAEYIKWCDYFGYDPTIITLDERLEENAKTHARTNDYATNDDPVYEIFQK